MIGLFSSAALVLAGQAVTALPGPEPEVIEQKPAAFESISAGNYDAAINQLETRLAQDPQDPALLINLGAAYAATGRMDRAAAAYRAAIDSPVRYSLELADGRWIDSRRAARIAFESLSQSGNLAMQ